MGDSVLYERRAASGTDRYGPRFPAGRTTMVLLLLPVLYVLSVGPVLKFDIRFPGEGQFYLPLVLAMVHSPRFERAMEWYLWNVWRVPMMRD